MLNFLKNKSKNKNNDIASRETSKKLNGNSVGENKHIVNMTSLKKSKTKCTVDEINEYVGKVVSKGKYTEMFKHITDEDTYMVGINDNLDLRKLLEMICTHLETTNEFEAVKKSLDMYKEFNWLTRDLIILAYINKSLRLGRPEIRLRNYSNVVIPSVILCSQDDYSFITGYIVHHGLGYEMQEVRYGDKKAYAPCRTPIENENDLSEILYHLNYQYTLLY